MTEEEKLLEQIWEDADFKSKKNVILDGESKKKNRIRRLNNDNFYVANCKVCNCEIKLSNRYNGEFPLCRQHRDPNDRPLK